MDKLDQLLGHEVAAGMHLEEEGAFYARRGKQPAAQGAEPRHGDFLNRAIRPAYPHVLYQR